MKYTSWAFQNRSGNIAATSSSVFMILWSLMKIMKNATFGTFWSKQEVLHEILKNDLDVSRIFPERFWKARNVYFGFLRKYLKFGTFCNPNGILVFYRPKRDMDTFWPFWFQKGIKIWKFVDATYIFGNYESSAFQIRSQNFLSTSGYDFMSSWSLVKTAKK